MYSLPFTALLNNTELEIFGRHWDSNPGTLLNAQLLCHRAMTTSQQTNIGGDQIFLILYC